MSDMAHTPLQSQQDDGETVPKNSGPKADTKTASSSGKKDKKFGFALTPVESLLFFNIVRFSREPTNVDWAQVASHSNLKNAGSAKVRFRQIQRKYSIDFKIGSRQMKRKSRATVAEDDDDDDDEEEDADDGPLKKRFNNPGSRGTVSESRASRKKAATQEGFDGEGSAFGFAVSSSPAAKPFASTQQAQYEQQVQGQIGSSIKQKSTFSQMQTMEASFSHGTSPYHPHEQHGHSQPSLPDNANAPHHMGATQHSGVGKTPELYQSQAMHGMSGPQESQLFTQQQQTYLQNLQRMYRERAAQRVGFMDPYTQSEPQSQLQAYMTQPDGDQYDQFGDFPIIYKQTPQAVIDTLHQSVGSQPQAQGLTQATAQSPATTMAHDNFTSSQDYVSFQSAPESPFQSMFDEMVQTPGAAASPPDTTAETASRAETI